MAITTDASALEAKYGNKTGAVQPTPIQDLYAPGVRGGGRPTTQGQIPIGTPIPEGVIIEQRVGRAMAPSMQVVPPKANEGPQPQIAIVPPSGSGRTSIGTFVEVQQTATELRQNVPAPVSPTTSNPLVVEQPPASEREPKKIDYVQAILDHMHELGGHTNAECQKFYGRSAASLKQYTQNPAAIPLECFLKFIKRRPGLQIQIQDELEPHFQANGQEGWARSLPNRGRTDAVVCAAVLDRPTLPFMWTLLYLAKKYELGFDVQSDTVIHRSRNMLAHRFLQSKATWSLWIDSDMACPIANPDWFKWITGANNIPEEATGYDVLSRLLGHGKAVVGGVYASRKYHGSLVIQPEVHPRNQEDKLLANDIRKGTARGLAAVDWVGFGCALVHREVFLELQRRFPQLAPQSEFFGWRFFQPEGDEGEDEAFCRRVRACEIPIWLDTQLVCGHIGPMAFMPEHSAPRPGI